MKIIKSPIEFKVNCKSCGCEYEFDPEDIVTFDGEICQVRPHVRCPICKQIYWIGHKETKNERK